MSTPSSRPSPRCGRRSRPASCASSPRRPRRAGPTIPTSRRCASWATTPVSNGPFGYAFPKGVDPAIQERMGKALADVMKDETVTSQIAKLGIQPVYRDGKDVRRAPQEDRDGAGSDPQGNRHGQEAGMTEAGRHADRHARPAGRGAGRPVAGDGAGELGLRRPRPRLLPAAHGRHLRGARPRRPGLSGPGRRDRGRRHRRRRGDEGLEPHLRDLRRHLRRVRAGRDVSRASSSRSSR